MAKARPRIAVTLPANTIATLDKLSRLQRRPKSAIAADLLVEMTPALVRITSLLEAAIANRSKLPSDTAARFEELEKTLLTAATYGLDRMDEIVDNGERPPRSRAPRGRRRGH